MYLCGWEMVIPCVLSGMGWLGVGSFKLLCRCRRFGAGRLVIRRLFQCGVLGAGGWETGVLDAANTLNTRAGCGQPVYTQKASPGTQPDPKPA